MRSPVVELNRAVAVGMAEGPHAGSAHRRAPCRTSPRMKTYHLLSSVRVACWISSGRFERLARPPLPTMMWSCTAMPSGRQRGWLLSSSGYRPARAVVLQLILSASRFGITDFCQPREAFLTYLAATPASDWVAPPYMGTELRRGTALPIVLTGSRCAGRFRLHSEQPPIKRIPEERAGRAIAKSLTSECSDHVQKQPGSDFIPLCKRGMPRRIMPSVHPRNA